MKNTNQGRLNQPAPILNLETLLNNLDKQIKSGQEISPKQWPMILKLLTEREVSAGGPYYNKNQVVDLKLNLKISKFLKSQKIVLPKLEKFLNQKSTTEKLKKADHTTSLPDDESKIYNTIHRQIVQNIKTWPKPINGASQQEHLNLKNSRQSQEISLLPLWFIKSLAIKLNKKYYNLAIDLGKANFYLWLAYKIYDDILDGESGVSLLPTANLFFKNFIVIFKKQRLGYEWDKFLDQIINELENQNYQEFCVSQKYSKQTTVYPKSFNFKKEASCLYKKSMAHATGPLAILLKLKVDSSTKEFKTIFSFFKNYLNARQLDDDIHDWTADLKRKKISPVIIFLMKKIDNKIKNKEDLETLKRIMLNVALPEMSKQLSIFINNANNALRESILIKEPKYLQRLTSPIIENIAQTEKQRDALLKFQDAYRKF